MIAEIKTGPVYGTESSQGIGRSSKIGCQIIGYGQGKYYEQASRGNIYSLILPAWTTGIAAGQIYFGAGTNPTVNFALWNPQASQFNIALVKFQVWIISATTMPTNNIYHGYTNAPTIASNVLNPIQCNNVGLKSESVAHAVSSAAGTALTGSASPIPNCGGELSLGGGTLTTANLFEPKITEYLDGSIVIAPGSCWLPLWTTMGTACLGGYSVTWEEIPV